MQTQAQYGVAFLAGGTMKVIIAAIVGFFFGTEFGYVYLGHGMPEAPQTWAVIAGLLAVAFVASLVWHRSHT